MGFIINVVSSGGGKSSLGSRVIRGLIGTYALVGCLGLVLLWMTGFEHFIVLMGVRVVGLV
jgi:hypothetical protein